MKIKVITDRGVWASSSRLTLGEVRELPTEEANILINAGFAENVDNRNDERVERKADSKPKPRRTKHAKGQPKAS